VDGRIKSGHDVAGARVLRAKLLPREADD
jgi:hypothetical protein